MQIEGTEMYRGHLSPPFTDLRSSLAPASIPVRLKKLVALLFGGWFVSGLIGGAAYLFDLGWLRTIAIVLAVLAALIAVVTAVNAKIATCPYCQGKLGTTAFDSLTSSDENEQIECGHCFEWLVSHNGEVRAYTQNDADGVDKFEAPVFREGSWPNECVVCGGMPTRVEEAKKVKVELPQLVIGTLSVASASVRGIPFCGLHKEAVGLTIRDDYARLVFSDYAARRRYVSCNKGKTPLQIK